jgi:hypothetical protein
MKLRLAAATALSLIAAIARADNCSGLSDCYGTIAAAVAVVVAIAVVIAIIAFLPEILAAVGLGGEAAGVGGFLEGAGPWVAEATGITEGGAVLQSTGGSCVSAVGEMLSGGAMTEAEFLAQLGEWSNPGALARALNALEGSAVWEGGYFASGADALVVAGEGEIGAVLQAPFLPSHMVAIKPAAEAGWFLVRDPAIGGTYRVTAEWIAKWVSGGVF